MSISALLKSYHSDTFSSETAGQWRLRTEQRYNEIYIDGMESISMVVSLAAYVHASATSSEHKFQLWFAFLLFVADVFIAGAISPGTPLG